MLRVAVRSVMKWNDSTETSAIFKFAIFLGIGKYFVQSIRVSLFLPRSLARLAIRSLSPIGGPAI